MCIHTSHVAFLMKESTVLYEYDEGLILSSRTAGAHRKGCHVSQACYISLSHDFEVFRSYSELLSKFGAISFQEYVSKGITHPVFYGDLVYKLRRVKNESNFISSGSKIVKRLRRRQYDPEIIEKTIGLVLGPFTAFYRSFLKRCTLTNKAVGTI